VPPRSLAIVAAIIAIVIVVGYAVWRSSLNEVEPTPEPEAAPTAAAPATPPQPAPAPAPAVTAGQPVTLVATGPVWLRVTDGPGGASLFQGELAAGQTFAVPPTAQRPLLRTGRPQMLRATVGGRDIGPLDTVERTVSDVSLLSADLANRVQAATPQPAR